MSDHIAVADLAEAEEDLLDPARAAEVAAHVASCPECTRTVARLRQVSTVLAAMPVVPMPESVVSRLDGVVEDEHVRRAAKQDHRGGSAWQPRAGLGDFQVPQRAKRSPGRLVLGALAAAALAGLVGFGGYWASASLGLNEPPVSAVSIDSKHLGAGAGAIRSSTALGPHRFSRAWDCARQATRGRIVGLTSATVDGRPALLVYIATNDATTVTVVTGCGTGHPIASESTTLPR